MVLLRQPVKKNNLIALELKSCLAKTYQSIAGDKLAGRQVLNHIHIVGEVARELLQRMPNWLVTELFPPGSELIAAAHDIGKVSPTFQEKLYRGTDGYTRNTKVGLEKVNPDMEKQWGGHAGVSQITAQYLKLGKYIPEILGQHHGYSPNISIYNATDEVFGGLAWQQRREELLIELKYLLDTEFPVVTTALQARVLAGFTTVSDWIGSGSLFDIPSENWQPNIKRALDNAGFIQPVFKPLLSFSDIFGWQPRPIQQSFIHQVTGPGVYILEAPMGLGKTEAALYAAYQMLSTHQATGIYFALPTQLTSEKIHERVEVFLKAILDNDSSHQQPLLLHGNAWLKTELGKEGNPGGSWFQAAKRGILAPFAVGTIDQALMAVMNVKHGFVRTFGLAGKVVILDEVHSYDSYTGTLIDELINALTDLHCTVIILSATLTQQRRSTFLKVNSTNPCYPLVSALPKGGKLVEVTDTSITDVNVKVTRCQQDEVALEAALLRAEQGQQVLWIENTVTEAQAICRLLATRASSLGVECGLLHSRFLKIDREQNEKYWTTLYGKDGAAKRSQQGRILIGTQVLEQSLDIDADFLISRFAPSDMLLQRIGRLWRHDLSHRPVNIQREVWLLSPDLKNGLENPEKAFGKTAKVYAPYVLCRSLEVWQGLQDLSIPSQIRDIIEATYQERSETGLLLSYLNALEKKKGELKSMALIGLSEGGKTLSEEKASTRYSDQDTVDVLLIKNYQTDPQQSGVSVRFLDETQIHLPDKGKGLEPKERRELAAKLLQNTVRVAEYLAPKPIIGNGLDWLKDYIYLGKSNEESRLRVAKVKGSDELMSLEGGKALESYQLEYNQKLGYQANK
jgi:CRISPR-associated endonuclease/helicase Cas3